MPDSAKFRGNFTGPPCQSKQKARENCFHQLWLGIRSTGCHSYKPCSFFSALLWTYVGKSKEAFPGMSHSCWIRLRTEQGVWVYNQRGPCQRKSYNNLQKNYNHKNNFCKTFQSTYKLYKDRACGQIKDIIVKMNCSKSMQLQKVVSAH